MSTKHQARKKMEEAFKKLDAAKPIDKQLDDLSNLLAEVFHSIRETAKFLDTPSAFLFGVAATSDKAQYSPVVVADGHIRQAIASFNNIVVNGNNRHAAIIEAGKNDSKGNEGVKEETKTDTDAVSGEAGTEN